MWLDYVFLPLPVGAPWFKVWDGDILCSGDTLGLRLGPLQRQLSRTILKLRTTPALAPVLALGLLQRPLSTTSLELRTTPAPAPLLVPNKRWRELSGANLGAHRVSNQYKRQEKYAREYCERLEPTFYPFSLCSLATLSVVAFATHPSNGEYNPHPSFSIQQSDQHFCLALKMAEEMRQVAENAKLELELFRKEYGARIAAPPRTPSI